MHSAPPWPVILGFILLFIGMGIFYTFWTDKICEWQIRLLQSRTYRLCLRGIGALFMFLGVIGAIALATGKLN
jgi:protein-S-isoprenylcysteine O-methyltransferase Ste14